MAELRIPIVVENKGKKALGDVDKGIKGITKSFGKLAGAAGIGLSTAAVINFGKQAAKAFIDDQKAASRLAVSVKNLGLAFETPRIEKFISDLSKASGVTDDALRPSMQKLLQTTGSVAKSTELLTQALDISRGSGVEYETVVNDLSMAYVGQTRGLRKYSLGLSQAELKAMSFTDVQSKLTDQFKGSNAEYLTTYAGKMELLNTAAGEAKETIGKGLVDALSLLAGEGNTVQPLADSMADFSTYVSDAIVGVAVLIDKLKKIPGVGESNAVSKGSFAMFPSLGSLAILKKGLDYVSKTGAEYQALRTPITQGYLGSMPVGIYPTSAELSKQNQLEKERLKRERDRAALDKKSLIEAKKKIALDKASKTLNLEAIGIEAALKGQISETDRISLLLQKSILEGNAAQATKLSAQLEAAVKRQNELAALLLATPKAPNPYEAWKIPDEILNWAASSLGVSKEILIKDPASIAMPETDAAREMLDAFIDGQRASEKERMAKEQADTIVKLYIDGEELTSSITKTQTNQSLSGSFNQVNRSGRFENIAV
jgi:hypothetical protein